MVGDIGAVGSKLPGCHCGQGFGDFFFGTQFSPKVHIFIDTSSHHYPPQVLKYW